MGEEKQGAIRHAELTPEAALEFPTNISTNNRPVQNPQVHYHHRERPRRSRFANMS
jgi:hypothetical protein